MHRAGGINMNLNNIISERLRDSKLEPSLRERYNIALKKEFSDDLPNCGLFIDDTFYGDDAIDYEKGIRLFRGKKWTEVDFDYLYEEYVQFLMLNDDGFIYYLPSFLLYFYDLKHFALEYYLYFMDKLELGLNESKATYNAGRRRQDYSGFNKLSHEQSKLVAIFLVNTANLLPDGYMEKTQAQRALTNYWGNFLIF